MTANNSIAAFRKFSNEIESVLSNILNNNLHDSSQIVNNILNGKTTDALNELVPLDVRRSNGIFFTSTQLAEKVSDRIKNEIKDGASIIDPACGAGNLLLSCLYHLQKKTTLKDTLEYWSGLIYGYDLHSEFIFTAKLRFLLYAISLFPNEQIKYSELHKYFNNITIKNSLLVKELNTNQSCVVINPPFGYTYAPEKCVWGTGQVQLAAVFMEKVIRDAPEDQSIIAILPDVLRSGSRYNKWRSFISDNSKYIDIESCGKFDKDTDVDVFILHIIKSSSSIGLSFNTHLEAYHRLSDYFDICVGPVVPHRDPIGGKSFKFLHAKNAPANDTITRIEEKRQYKGKKFLAPFLTIHRTSSPSDKQRCKVSVINTKGEIAVENHLIILQPKDGSLDTCYQFQNLLSSLKTTEWLNDQIRCRHLTVTSIKNIPVKKEIKGC